MARKSVSVTISEPSGDTSAVTSPDVSPSGSTDNTVGDSGNASANEPEVIYGFETVEPGDIGTAAGGGDTIRRRRGRPPGSGTGTRAPKTKSNLGGFEAVLLSVHMFAASAFGAAEIALAPEEASQLATAINTVAAQYNKTMDPKVMAWLQLAGVVGMIYGTRVFAIRERMKSEATKPSGSPGPAKVVDFRQPESKPQPAPGRAGPIGARTPADLFGMDYFNNTPSAALSD